MNATATTASDPASAILISLVAKMVLRRSDVEVIESAATEGHPAFDLVSDRHRNHATKILRAATTPAEATTAIATAAKYLRGHIIKRQANA